MISWFLGTQQAPTYHKIESRYPPIPSLAPVLKLMDELVEKRDLHTLRVSVAVYLRNQNLLTEELIKGIDAQSHCVSHTGAPLSAPSSRTAAEQMYDECVFWRNEFFELFFSSANVEYVNR